MTRIAFERGDDICDHLIGGKLRILDPFTTCQVPRIIPCELANSFALFRCTVEVHKIHHGDHGFSVSETMRPETIAAHTSAKKNLYMRNLLDVTLFW